MAKWQVWNKHPNGLKHTERFRDQMIEIPAGEFILMDYEDAVQFRGQFTPIVRTPMGDIDPKSYKVIELKPHDPNAKQAQSPKKYVCNMDGREFQSQSELDAYLEANYADATFTDETLETEIKTEKRRGRPAKAG